MEPSIDPTSVGFIVGGIVALTALGLGRRLRVRTPDVEIDTDYGPEGDSGPDSAEAAERPEPEDTSMIIILPSSGVTHQDMSDPKPDAPDEYRGEFGAVPTEVPGIEFTEPMPEQSLITDKSAVVRSVRHDDGGHGVFRGTDAAGPADQLHPLSRSHRRDDAAASAPSRNQPGTS